MSPTTGHRGGVARATLALLFFLSACSTAVVGLGGDTPMGDAGFSCLHDVDCAPWHGLCGADGGCEVLAPDGGWSCAPASGPEPCSVFATEGAETYCTDPNGNNLCYCHPDPYFALGGVCYRAIGECGSCGDSIDCGGTETDLNGGNGSTCLPVSDAGTFCLYDAAFGGCGRGYRQVTDSAGNQVCFPFCNTCPCQPCLDNGDCPSIAVGVCGSSGACVAPCLARDDCPPNQVCNVLGKYLDPALGPLYGGGQCGPSCASAPDCEPLQGDAGPQLSCTNDRRYPDGGLLDDAGARCRLDGCMGSEECVAMLTDGGGVSWCDLWGPNACVSTYCQVGNDDDGGAYADWQCQKGFRCLGDAGPDQQDDAGPMHGVCTPVPA